MAGEIPRKTGVGDSQGCRGLWEGSEESLKGVSNMQTNNGELLGVVLHQEPGAHYTLSALYSVRYKNITLQDNCHLFIQRN